MENNDFATIIWKFINAQTGRGMKVEYQKVYVSEYQPIRYQKICPLKKMLPRIFNNNQNRNVLT